MSAPVLHDDFVLDVSRAAYIFGSRTVFSDINFSLRRGEIVGLVGNNGAGKSTLFKLLNGLYRWQAGELYFCAQKAASLGKTTSSFMRLNTGVVFQEPSLDSKLSAQQNLLLSGRLFGVNPTVLKRRASELLAYVNLKSRENDVVKSFSGGMKRRLELARALMHEPRFLLMDEPTNGLDHEGFAAIWRHLQTEKQRRELSVFLTTHRVDEAECCDRLLVLHDGKIVADSTPAELKKLVSGDRIDIHTKGGFANLFTKNFPHLQFYTNNNHTHLFAHDAHQLVPRLVESLPQGAIESIAVTRPSLADVFLRLTGTTWQGEATS